MQFDLCGADAERAYQLLASLVCPRPIAWVTTLNEDGSVNAAPFSFFNVLGDDPPMVMFCPGNREDGSPKDTARNCRRSGEFVINLVDEAIGQQMVHTSASLPYGVSETEKEGIALSPGSTIAVPFITNAPAALECVVHDIQEIGNNRLIIGLVNRIHVRDELVDSAQKRIRTDLYHPVGRMAVPDWYCRTSDQYAIPRPR
jgi:flavin reductase (DIM6/NTAB) family NADH-FMN oxidoreductase RutF